VKARLLPREALIATGPVDRAEWNYRPLLGWLQRRRFALLLSLMGSARYRRLLEVGYGSGVLMPELARRCDELFGIDPHTRERDVAAVLARHGVAATLVSGDATRLPFTDRFFEAVVAVSSLEYVHPLEAACAELRRVLVPGGALLVVTPGHSPLLDLALRLATGESAAENYADRREHLVPTLCASFRLAAERRFPRVVGRVLPVYRALYLLND
jgi:ubiquinone/menaquinone biosynthesis C-methylase UbiE